MSFNDDFMGDGIAAPTVVDINNDKFNTCALEKQELFQSILNLPNLIVETSSMMESAKSSKKAKKSALFDKLEARATYVFLLDFANPNVCNDLMMSVEALPLCESRFVLCFRFSADVDPFVLPNVFIKQKTNMRVLLKWLTDNCSSISIPRIPKENIGYYLSHFTSFFDFCDFMPSGCSIELKHLT